MMAEKTLVVLFSNEVGVFSIAEDLGVGADPEMLSGFRDLDGLLHNFI